MAQTPQPVPQTQWDKALESLHREAELVQERIRLITRLREIDLERLGFQVAPAQQAAVEPRTVKAATPGQAQDKAPAPASGDGKTVDLPTLLGTISQQVKRPLKLADFVILVREAGYTTKAKDFSNMVYQSLLKLVRRGTLTKNAETREYAHSGEKAA